MKDKIMTDLLLRPGLTEKEFLLSTLVEDSIAEMRGFLNIEENEEIPEGCIPAIKELTMLRFNLDGVEGIQSETQSSGGSTTYMDDLPKRVKKAIKRYRRLPR